MLGIGRGPVRRLGAAPHGQRRPSRGPAGGWRVVVHRPVQLDLELQLAGVLGEAAKELLQRRLLAPLLAEQVLGEDQVDGRFGVVPDRGEGVEVMPRRAPTGPAGTAPPGRPAGP